ncbi:magnesium transporter [Sporohalobacter salinus]|uniref:magnesium transporter n=1 Tax=Sporohalobacter salinus TaxID=1494606 RepID=UPI0019614EDC|nr:magnesium transporter [Sporohalobacter salinus]MBM7623165.1 magnesium transporter [Sporohalobacter salinus]
MEEVMADKIKELIAQGNEKLLQQKVDELYPADLAEILVDTTTKETKILVKLIEEEKLADVLAEVDYEVEKKLLTFLSNNRLTHILDEMYSDDVADLLGALNIGQTKELLTLMKEEKAEQIQHLLGYDEESAGGRMTTEYIAMKQEKTVEESIQKLRDIAPEAEMVYYVYVVDEKQELKGVLSMRELIAAPPEKKIKDIMHEQVITVNVSLDQEEVARLISKYDLLAVPVVNNRGLLLGIITFDDILDVIEEEATEDMHRMAGNVELDVEHRGEIINGVIKRLPWLIILLFASLLSANVLEFFEGVLSSVVILTFFMPTLAGTGGNAATQSLAVVVRGLGTGDIRTREILEYLGNELKVGVLIALACGLIIGTVAFLWQGNYMLGVVVGLAMIGNIITATIVGTTMPFIINYLGADPAVAAGPFITTLIDVFGYFIYFSLAKLFINYL